MSSASFRMGLRVTFASTRATTRAAPRARAPRARVYQKASSRRPRRSGIAMPSRIAKTDVSLTLKGRATS